MKDLFKGFSQPDETRLKELWKEAVFVFDTNVLTNLYRYRLSTSEELLKLMEQLGDRVWIPYHVALEYHRNRLSVIHDQHKKFSETKSAISSATDSLKKELQQLQLANRHSHIEPNTFIEKISDVSANFSQELDELEKSSMKVDSTDTLLERLESLFEGKVGEKPTQEFINEIEKAGKFRFEHQIPPGYLDADKDKKSDGLYTFGGVNYQRQYGDLIVWKQIIEHVKSGNLKHLIFVTDDSKEDWWQKTKGKTSGLRVELVDEIYRETELSCFYAYSSNSFLYNANVYLEEKISAEAIEDVRTVSSEQLDDGSIRIDALLKETILNRYKVDDSTEGLITIYNHQQTQLIEKKLSARSQLNSLYSKKLELKKNLLTMILDGASTEVTESIKAKLRGLDAQIAHTQALIKEINNHLQISSDAIAGFNSD
ncbi:DUF4935 domain-containing protein [Vibrio parahaemolyticus]|nr:DUF4935 domain-containing protein [Vibrio parahaemolyticus]